MNGLTPRLKLVNYAGMETSVKTKKRALHVLFTNILALQVLA